MSFDTGFFPRIAVIGAVLILAGCAATVERPSTAEPRLTLPASSTKEVVVRLRGSDQATKSSDWDLHRAEWREGVTAVAAEKGYRLDYEEGEMPRGRPAGTGVIVMINAYRHVRPGTRFIGGVLTGNAYLDVEAEFIDLKDGRSAGRRKYGTTTRFIQGVFAPVTDKQVRAVVAEILDEIERAAK